MAGMKQQVISISENQLLGTTINIIINVYAPYLTPNISNHFQMWLRYWIDEQEYKVSELHQELHIIFN